MFQISQLNQGTGNFNYTIDSHVKPYCPFFPGSYGSADHDWPRVSIATENGDDLVRILDAEEKSMEDVSVFFNSQFQRIEEIVQEAVNSLNSMSGVYVEYKGLDTSFNPGSLLPCSALTSRPFVDVLAGQRARAVQQSPQLQEVPVRRQRELDAGASPHVDRADDAGEARGLLRNDAPRAGRLRAGRAVDRATAEQHDVDGSRGGGEWV